MECSICKGLQICSCVSGGLSEEEILRVVTEVEETSNMLQDNFIVSVNL